MIMFMTVLMQMIVVVRMLVGVGMFVLVFMGVDMTVVGVLVRMNMGVLVIMLATGDMVVIDVHGIILLYCVTSSASTNRLVIWIGMGRRLIFAARNTHSSISWQQAFSSLTTVMLAISL